MQHNSYAKLCFNAGEDHGVAEIIITRRECMANPRVIVVFILDIAAK